MHNFTLNQKCSRCPREERTEVTAEDIVKMAKGGLPSQPKALVVTVDGKTTVEFGFLCGVCQTIVERYLGHAAKRPKHQSALRGDAKIEIEDD